MIIGSFLNCLFVLIFLSSWKLFIFGSFRLSIMQSNCVSESSASSVFFDELMVVILMLTCG